MHPQELCNTNGLGIYGYEHLKELAIAILNFEKQEESKVISSVIMNFDNIIIHQGRSGGMTALTKRLSDFSKITSAKNVHVGWENNGSCYNIFIENNEKQRIFEEVVLTKGVVTVEKIHAFLDIFENELQKQN